MAAVADHKGIRLDTAEVRLRYRISEGSPWRTEFHSDIELGPHLTDREHKILFNSARLCEVNKILSGEFAFTYHAVGRVHGKGNPNRTPPR